MDSTGWLIGYRRYGKGRCQGYPPNICFIQLNERDMDHHKKDTALVKEGESWVWFGCVMSEEFLKQLFKLTIANSCLKCKGAIQAGETDLGVIYVWEWWRHEHRWWFQERQCKVTTGSLIELLVASMSNGYEKKAKRLKRAAIAKTRSREYWIL